jgi:hypothetical protein
VYEDKSRRVWTQKKKKTKKKRTGRRMDLFETAELTPEQRFLLMLQERVDALSDEVHELRKQLLDTTPPTKASCPANMECADPGRRSSTAFVRVRCRDEAAVERALDAMKRGYARVESFVFVTRPSSALIFDKYHTAGTPSSQTLQALVTFDSAEALPSRLGIGLSAHCDRVEVCALLPEQPWSALLYDWYMWHLAAVQCDTPDPQTCTSTHCKLACWCRGAKGGMCVYQYHFKRAAHEAVVQKLQDTCSSTSLRSVMRDMITPSAIHRPRD